jgi:antitoxin component YwqK of YwqJK toxin-antitoxin module
MDEGDRRVIEQIYRTGEKKSLRQVKRTAEGVVNHGPYVRWYRNGVVALEGEYVDGLQQGVFLERFDTGQMRVETPYLEGREHGLKKEWSDIGFVKKEVHFEHGELHGPYATFLMIHEGGPRLPHITGQHERGRKVGPWTYHYLSSEKRDQGEFVDGAREGLWTTWNQDGSLAREAHYRAGEFHGELIEYEQGVKVSTSTYDMGTASGPQVLWYANGQKRLERTFVDGEVTGPASTWYESGQLESRGELVDGEKEGAWQFRRRDGSPDPQRSGEYERGERVP